MIINKIKMNNIFNSLQDNVEQSLKHLLFRKLSHTLSCAGANKNTI